MYVPSLTGFIYPQRFSSSLLILPSKMSSSQRIGWQLKRLQRRPLSFVEAGPVDQDLFRWEGTMQGPDNTPYEGRCFKIDIYFPPDYNFKPPKIMFRTPVYHPNVTEGGGILLKKLTPEYWSPGSNMVDVFEMIYQMLAEPILDNPTFVVEDIAECYKNEKEVFEWIARSTGI